MGFGLPAAMGAQAAQPDALVVDIDGDGSFLMNIQELGTVFCENLPVKIIVLNNQHLGMVVQWEDRFHAGNRAYTYLGPVHLPEAVGQGEGELPADQVISGLEVSNVRDHHCNWQRKVIVRGCQNASHGGPAFEGAIEQHADPAGGDVPHQADIVFVARARFESTDGAERRLPAGVVPAVGADLGRGVDHN